MFSNTLGVMSFPEATICSGAMGSDILAFLVSWNAEEL
jgi:hypothetical protein